MSAIQALPSLEGASAEEILRWTYANHRRVAIVASFQAESSVLIHLAAQVVERPEVVTLDTGRLPEETHQAMDAFRSRYPIRLQVQAPDPAEVAEMVGEHGPNLFYDSVELRRHCCEVRKSRPLVRALAGYDAWVTGVRRQQAETRAGIAVVASDPAHGGIAKVAPLAGWSRDQVWTFIRENRLPVHPLYQRGYTSIGCQPCTRATKPGEDERAGRWFWETGAVKECGIHYSNGSER
ncbi:MAG: phosphoadenylyl-sulfate reductase [Chloroflexi bacterium]|nr:MAG: phosphoadenylyl-sulfate reductase [Chloroflexota bacterium]TMD51031.1 MAG: phosphoadenylyl-sulfate reductase [Chloroflexota bacterium]